MERKCQNGLNAIVTKKTKATKTVENNKDAKFAISINFAKNPKTAEFADIARNAKIIMIAENAKIAENTEIVKLTGTAGVVEVAEFAEIAEITEATDNGKAAEISCFRDDQDWRECQYWQGWRNRRGFQGCLDWGDGQLW